MQVDTFSELYARCCVRVLCLVQVWVPYKTGAAAGSSDLPEQLSDAAFEELTSKAARLAAEQRRREQPYQPPSW